MLAEYLKVDDRIVAAKCLYMRNNKKVDGQQQSYISDDDAIAAFDRQHAAASFHSISSNDVASCMQCNTSN
jgi:hypothetical protein